MSQHPDLLIVGGGIFGLTAALELHQRGLSVVVLDPGPLPNPLAASTDISKAVRMAYGADEQYTEMGQAAIQGWLDWNTRFAAPLFHQVGLLMLSQTPLAPGGFEYESFQRLQARHPRPTRLDAAALAARFPAWQTSGYAEGIYSPAGGFAESGRVVAALAEQAQAVGIKIFIGQAANAIEHHAGRFTGVRTREGGRFTAGQVLVAAGAWTPELLPELRSQMRITGHPVFHLKPNTPKLFAPEQFPVFTADITRSGWYGFPLHPKEGVVKIANHGVGVRLHPEHDLRVVTPQDEQHLRAFLRTALPALAEAPVVYTRRCLYCDTLDEHFWIDRHPTLQGVTVAAGGSGHAFKFAPILGALIADAVQGQPNPWLPRFAWRDLTTTQTGEEAARFHGETG